MAIDYNQLINFAIPDAVQNYDERDCILYALGLGFGADPVDPRQLRYVYEKDLVAFPAMAVILAMGSSWARQDETGITYAQLLHAEQQFQIHRPLPIKGSVVSRSRVSEVIDKGEGRGAIVVAERRLFIDGEETPSATLSTTLFCRADGGFGGPVTASPKPRPFPDGEPDLEISIATLPQAALIYRLSGDDNPLHSDPAVAAKAGFNAPILHGLCSFGIAVRSVVEGLDLDPAMVTGGGARFTAPVYPGETLTTSIWRAAEGAYFRTRIADRDLMALNHGWITAR